MSHISIIHEYRWNDINTAKLQYAQDMDYPSQSYRTNLISDISSEDETVESMVLTLDHLLIMSWSLINVNYGRKIARVVRRS